MEKEPETKKEERRKSTPIPLETYIMTALAIIVCIGLAIYFGRTLMQMIGHYETTAAEERANK